MQKTLIAALLLAPSLAHAQASVEAFYKSKPIDMHIGYPPGGSNDVYARILAQHMGKHIPGNPSIIVHNTPGAGSFVAVNQVFAVSPKDGSVIAIGAPTTAIDEKLGTQGVRFKTAQLNWIGRINSLVNIVMTWKTSPVKTIADAQQREQTDARQQSGYHAECGATLSRASDGPGQAERCNDPGDQASVACGEFNCGIGFH